MKRTRVPILGGGFGGLYAALEFEKRRDPEFEVTLISQENFDLRGGNVQARTAVARLLLGRCQICDIPDFMLSLS